MAQDVGYGDLLMGDDSEPRRVFSIARGRETMYRIVQEYGENYTVNESHILSLKLCKSPKIRDVSKRNSFVVGWYDSQGENTKTFSYENQDKKSIKQKCLEFTLSLPSKESVMDISVREYLSRSKNWKSAFRGYKVGVEFNNSVTGTDPYIFGYKTQGVLPDEYKYSQKQIRKKVLTGMLDSKVYESNTRVKNEMIWLARSLGFRIVCTDKVFISQSPGALMYKIKVEKLEEDEYFGFEIDGNRRFLLGDFTVTHNTSVAKIISKIYQAMNILSTNGIFKIAYRDDFLAGYLGQTATKTKKLLNSCIGGVLFIDEAYALAPRQNDKDSFAKEAIDTINGFLSEHKNDFCCIIAGYEEEVVNCFFGMNRGLERRFPWTHRIEPYSSKDLSQIFMKMVSDMKWNVAFEEKFLVDLFDKDKNMFKNAGGDIETFLTKCKMFHAKRVFGLGKEHKFVLTKQDVFEALEYTKKHNPKEDESWREQFV
jgi:hypothetical protein